jgi:hypothetical protein
VDLLSRRADHNQGKDDNKDVTLLKPEMFRKQEFEIQSVDKEIIDQIRDCKKIDTSVKTAVDKQYPGWESKDGIIYYHEKIYVPRNEELREKIISLHHDTPLSGHPGEYRTQELIERNYWWPRLGNQVKHFVQTCEPCQRTKIKRYRPGQLHPHEIIENPWEVISMDLISPLPESNGYNAIQVWADTSTKAIHIEPTDMHVTAEGVAKLTCNYVIQYHGVPRKIISDRDPQYASEYMRELYKLLGIQANISTAYRPQTDGQTERANQEIEQYLRIFVDIHQKDWNEWLALAEFLYNDKVNSSTKMSPFFMNTGRHP